MQRLITAAIGTPLALAALFLLPHTWWFLVIAVFIEMAAWEYLAIVRPRAPHAPLWTLLVVIPLLAVALSASAMPGVWPLAPEASLLIAATLVSVGLGSLILLSRTPLEEALPALGVLAFGIPYFAVPIASLHLLKRSDPWLVFLLMAIVWLGDSAAFYAGSRFGRHKMAPVVSPKKSWEGATAGFLISVAAAAVWSYFRLGRVDPALLGVAAVTAAAAQIGDLVESVIKRGAGVKDSGHVLPGHGGVFDRMDAMLFAAPVLLLGLWLLRIDGIVIPR
ncbi:MAG TPA: phosphatidate cytidylyltransferase [Thermoanaerobaculia bacterium]